MSKESKELSPKSPQKDPQSAGKSYVALLSHEGFEFIIEREAAEQSKMIREQLQVYAHFNPQETAQEASKARIVARIPLEDVGAPVLNLVCQYLAERRACWHSMSEFEQLKALDPTNPVDKELAVELLLAADYLDC